MIENDVDPAAGMLTLDRWRKERKPMEKMTAAEAAASGPKAVPVVARQCA